MSNELDYLGHDIALNDDFDISFENGDMQKVSYGKCVAQDLRKAIYKKIFVFLNNEDVSLEEIKEAISDTVELDPRVDLDTVEISVDYDDDGQRSFVVSFVPLGFDVAENLVVDGE